MGNSDIDKLTKALMTDSRMTLTNPGFDDMVMKQVLLESDRQLNRKLLLRNIMIFTVIELLIFALLLVLLLWFPGLVYFTTAIKYSMTIFQKIGNLAIEYDYLIFSFILVWLLDMRMNRKMAFLKNR
jgi:hypothetical protein